MTFLVQNMFFFAKEHLSTDTAAVSKPSFHQSDWPIDSPPPHSGVFFLAQCDNVHRKHEKDGNFVLHNGAVVFFLNTSGCHILDVDRDAFDAKLLVKNGDPVIARKHTAHSTQHL